MKKRDPRLRDHMKHRPIELERCIKTQPEIVLQYNRALVQAHAICQITRHIASGRPVSGWTQAGAKLAVRDHSESHGDLRDTNNWGADLLEIRNGELWVRPLNKQLEWVPPGLVVNGDEKPINPHSTSTKAIGRVPVSSGRSMFWSAMPFVSAVGGVLGTLVIMRGQTLT